MAESQFMPAVAPGSISRESFSIMERATRMRQEEEMMKWKRAQEEQNAILRPLEVARVRADLATGESQMQAAIGAQKQRAEVTPILGQARTDFNAIMKIQDGDARTTAGLEWISRYGQMANLQETQQEFSSYKDIIGKMYAEQMAIRKLGQTSELVTFNKMTEGFTPEERGNAARVATGIRARPSSAAIQYKEVVGPDGVTRVVAVDPRAVGAQVVGTGESFGSGVSPTKERENFEAGNRPITPTTLESQSTEEKAKATEKGKLAAEKAAAMPQRRAALETVDRTTDRLLEDIDDALSKVTSATAGPGGVILGNFPGTSAKDLQALLDTIVANIGFEALNAMRAASKTGGALGSITERELELLQATLANLKVGQSPKQLIENLKKARRRIAENAGAARRAFETDYGSSESPAKEEQATSEPIQVGKYRVQVSN